MIEEFRQQLEAAYDAWGASGGRTPQLFFELMDEAIELHSVLEQQFPTDPLAGPFLGKHAVLGYYTAIAESWKLLSVRTERLVAEGDTVVRVGHACWRNRQTLRLLDTPKVEVWTVWNGKAIRYLEMFDSHAYALAVEPLPHLDTSPTNLAIPTNRG
jgi:ketosteroid isomerase-like protein